MILGAEAGHIHTNNILLYPGRLQLAGSPGSPALEHQGAPPAPVIGDHRSGLGCGATRPPTPPHAFKGALVRIVGKNVPCLYPSHYSDAGNPGLKTFPRSHTTELDVIPPQGLNC